jgi:outer membrane lipoprotein-sorting protein
MWLPTRRAAQAAAISAAVVAGVLAGALFFSTGPIAFAQVQEALKNVRSYSFERAIGNGLTERVMVLDEFRSRRERTGWLGKLNDVTILDWKQRRALFLDRTYKTAQVRALYPTADVMADLRDAVTQFSQIPERASRKIGEKTVDGRSVIEFAVTDQQGEQHVLIDATTKMPIRTEWVGMNGVPPDAKVVDSNYSFQTTFDISMFSVSPPEGYAVLPNLEPRGKLPTDDVLRNLIVSADGGIGGVKYGMSKTQIVNVFGEPDGIEPTTVLDNRDPVIDGALGPQVVVEDTKLPAEKLLYNSRGFHLTVSDKFGLEAVDCLGPPLSGMFVREFLGSTTDGLRMGAKHADVIKALGGEPNGQLPVARFGEETLTYFFGPEGGSITFRLRSDVLCGITAGRRVTTGVEANRGPAVQAAPNAEDDSAAVVPASGTSAEQFTKIVAAYHQEANEFKQKLRAISDAEQRQAKSSTLLHLPEKYATQLLTLSSLDAGGTSALDCNRWVIVNVVDLSHATVTEAAANVAAHHAQNTELEAIIMRARFGGEHFRRLLEAILLQNRDRRMQGLACFAMGQNLVNTAKNVIFIPGKRDEARFAVTSPDERKRLRDEAERHFERVANEFGDVEWRERQLRELAEAFLRSLLSPVAVGKPAPNIDTLDVEGKQLRLSDFRGHVVVL